MVDNFAIAVSHLLVALAAWRLVWRVDLDREDPPVQDESGSGFFQKTPAKRQGTSGDA
ncbi:hypothetical protein [Blastomonas sp. AAP53]|uniref:hypothetical protein n=1 Tax=Blastomonas sp. AAP53 TaxID=1248760 RepID=UPI0002E9F375|nr:hypothetical protein [Blastomonas sp. AAP53]